MFRNKKVSILLTLFLYFSLFFVLYPFLKDINIGNSNKCLNIDKITLEKECYSSKYNVRDGNNTVLNKNIIKKMPLGIYKNPYIKTSSVLFVRTKRELELYVRNNFFININLEKFPQNLYNKNTVIFKKNTIIESFLNRPYAILVINKMENTDVFEEYEDAVLFTYYKYTAYAHPFKFKNENMQKTFVNFMGIAQLYRNKNYTKKEWSEVINELIIKNYTEKNKELLPALFLFKYITNRDSDFVKRLTDENMFYFSKRLVGLVYAYNYFDMINSSLKLDLVEDKEFIIKNTNPYDLLAIKPMMESKTIKVDSFGEEYFLLNRSKEFDFEEMYNFLKTTWNSSL